MIPIQSDQWLADIFADSTFAANKYCRLNHSDAARIETPSQLPGETKIRAIGDMTRFGFAFELQAEATANRT
jgi:hypothetical protein